MLPVKSSALPTFKSVAISSLFNRISHILSANHQGTDWTRTGRSSLVMAKSSPPVALHLFSRLPPELRDRIWFFCLPRRVVPLDDLLLHLRNQDEQQCWVSPRPLDRRAKASPFMASVCREARRAAFRSGNVENMETGTSLKYVCIQRKLDTLLFRWTCKCSVRAGHGEDMMELFL